MILFLNEKLGLTLVNFPHQLHKILVTTACQHSIVCYKNEADLQHPVY